MAKNVFDKIFKGKKFNEQQLQKYIDKVTGGVDLLNRAYAKLGLSADYFKEHPPFEVTGFDFGEFYALSPKIKHFRLSDKYVSDTAVITAVLLGSRQLYVYSVAYNSDFTLVKELLTEVFYRDISSIGIESGFVPVLDGAKVENKVFNYSFNFTFGGSKLSFPVPPDLDINNEKLFNMRKFIRDKKFLG